MRQETLIKIQHAIDLSIAELAGDINFDDARLSPILEEIAKLESLKLQFPDLAAIFEAALQALRPTAADFTDELVFLNEAKTDLEEEKKKFNGGAEGVTLHFYFLVNGQKKEIKDMQMKDTDKLELVTEVDDKLGFPTGQAISDLVLSCSDPLAGDVINDANGKPIFIAKAPSSQCKIQGNGKLADGSAVVAESPAFDIVPGDAAQLKISLGAVSAQ